MRFPNKGNKRLHFLLMAVLFGIAPIQEASAQEADDEAGDDADGGFPD